MNNVLQVLGLALNVCAYAYASSLMMQESYGEVILPKHAEAPLHTDQTKDPFRHIAPSPSNSIPFVSPKKFPSKSPPRNSEIPLPQPLPALPPPPPYDDCAELTCVGPLTNGLSESSCICVLPIKVAIQLHVALYSFFPSVSELASEISIGVFMKQSQVRVVGANSAADDPEKTIVLVDLVPIGEKFEETTAFIVFQRLWQKKVVVRRKRFGGYDVLYVQYPGLPPSPPLPPSTVAIIGSKPYPGNENSAQSMHPLGVDVRTNKQGGVSKSTLSIIALSGLVLLILSCVIASIVLLKHRDNMHQTSGKHRDSPETSIRSVTKPSGKVLSIKDSALSSPSLSSHSSTIVFDIGSTKRFSLSDLRRATDYFDESRLLGEGGFGRVYRGVLEDGTHIAIKVLKRVDRKGADEFFSEVQMLSRLHHRNLVKLIGTCVEDRTCCLVYELVINGSLESHLHGKDRETAPLDWSTRLKIALGAARALAYLHEDSSPRVIHRDFKASNILLESDFTPRVSDLGLARTALDEEEKHVSTRVMGTFGYVAPEYAMTGHLLVKSDVYSYGVVLLELLTGKKPVDMSQPPGQENLVTWARPLLATPEGVESITDSSLGPDPPFESISKVAAIASMCVQPEVSNRPFMGEVVQALKLVCDEANESRSRCSSLEDLCTDADEGRFSTVSDQMSDVHIQSPASDGCYCYYRVDAERDVSGFLERSSSSGPLRMGRGKRIWDDALKKISRAWPTSH